MRLRFSGYANEHAYPKGLAQNHWSIGVR